MSASRDPRIPEGLGEKRTRVLEVALAELDLDVREQPPGSNRGPLVDRYLPSWARTTPGPAWCAFFACWVLRQALGNVPTGGVKGSVAQLRKDAMSKALWRPLEVGYLPAPGDLFVQDHGGGKGHTGIVIGASATAYATIEGNSGDRVRAGVRRFDDPKLVGFICTVPKEKFDVCWMPDDFGADLAQLDTR